MRLGQWAFRILGAAVLALGAASQAEAQGYGYGFGGWGWGGGWGGIGAMGMSPYDQAMVKEQYYMLNASRYNYMNANAAQSYMAANLMQQQAINTALQNQRLAYQLMEDRYNVRTKASSLTEAAQRGIPEIPLEQLINDQGQVLWPDVAPSAGAHAQRQQQANEAIRAAYGQFKTGGQASVQAIIDAKRRLHAYGEPALTLLQTRKDTRGRADLLVFLRALDGALDNMASPASK